MLSIFGYKCRWACQWIMTIVSFSQVNVVCVWNFQYHVTMPRSHNGKHQFFALYSRINSRYTTQMVTQISFYMRIFFKSFFVFHKFQCIKVHFALLCYWFFSFIVIPDFRHHEIGTLWINSCSCCVHFTPNHPERIFFSFSSWKQWYSILLHV